MAMMAEAVCCEDDPWTTATTTSFERFSVVTRTADAVTSTQQQRQRGFDDNFEPSAAGDFVSVRPRECDEAKQTERSEEESNDRSPRLGMPDSQEYLANLEAKLRRLKMSRRNERDEARQMVSELRLHKEGRWESAMQDVMPIEFSADALRDDPCAVPFLVRLLCPERGALTADELQRLVDSDCLTSLVDHDGDPAAVASPSLAVSPEA